MTLLIATVKSWNIKNAEILSLKYNVKLITVKKELTYENVKAINPRYIFFPHWSWIIPKDVWRNSDCIVFHMTDLPFGRGGSPLQNLIIRGYNKTKISAIKVTAEIDAGDIYLKKDLSLDGSAQEIYIRASNIIFNEMIPFIVENNPTPIPQEGVPTYFKRRKPDDGNLNNLYDLKNIYDHIRMLDAEGYPNAFLEINGIKYEFFDVHNNGDELIARVKIKRIDDAQ
jgi:methionyl-tRNA formyltransferase